MLHATFDIAARDNSSLDCEKLGARFNGKSDQATRLEEFRRIRGCGGLPSTQTRTIAPFKLTTCPCTFQNRMRFGHIWMLFDKYERHGTLPFAGPLTAQPAQLLEAFDVLRSLKHEFEKPKGTKKGK